MTPEAYLDALLSLPGMYGAEVSPDGKWVMWTWFRAAPAADIYVASTSGDSPPVRLTDTGDDTIPVSWTPDSKAVIVEQDKDGNERAVLFRIDIDNPLTMHPLTEDDPNYFIRGGEMHPDGKTLFYGANVDVDTGEEIEPTWIYRHDLETGERVAIAKPEKPAYTAPYLNSKGTHLLYGRADLHPSGRQMWMVDVNGERDSEVFNFGADVKCYAYWLPDGERVLVLAETDTHRKVGVCRMDNAGVGDIAWLIDDPERNIEGLNIPHNSAWVVVNEVRSAKVYSYLLDPTTGEEKHLPEVAGNLSLIAPTADDPNVWVASYSSSTQPTDLVRVNLDDARVEAFVSISRIWERTSLTKDDFTPAEDFRWSSVDGLEIQGWLYRTKDATPKGTVVYVHGGPTSHSRDFINNQIQFFAKSGFNVLDPNYRGSTGFSLAYRESIKEDGWGGREQDDIIEGVKALIAQGIAAAGKVGITGTSYGGYSSWCAITRQPSDIIAASAPICGMTDLVVDYHTTRPDLRPYSEEMLGGKPDDVPDRYFERSPINFVNNIQGRLLIVQGMKDPNVTPDNVSTVTKALTDANVEYGLLAFDDEGHGISRPRNQKTLYLKLLEFFSES